MKTKKIKTQIIIFILTLIFLFLLSVFAPTKSLGFKDALQNFINFIFHKEYSKNAIIIIFQIRLVRSLATIFCGASLSLSGLLLQAALNNTLASPGIIGVNSGAGLFVLLTSLIFPYVAYAKTLGSFCGALLSVLSVYFISKKAGISKTSLVLAGVAVSSLMTAGIDILITVFPDIVVDKISFSLGGFQNLLIQQFYFAVPVMIICVAISFFLANGIDLFELGDETAYGLGLNVQAYRISSIIVAGILAGSAVSVCGILGFLGLIVPNLVRLLTKEKFKYKIILSILIGSSFLLLCDLLARLLFFPYELPVGLILSCLGSPFFIYLLIHRKKHLEI